MVRSFLLALVVVLAATACGGSEPVATPAVRADQATATTVIASPLEVALGFPSDPERRQYQLIGLQRSADMAMVACMQQAGFFYAVRPAEEALRSGAFLGDGSRDWTIANGLGITSSFVDALAVDAAQTAPDAIATNQDYVASLGAQLAVEYDRALIGDVSADATTGEYTPGGCFADSFTDILQLLAVLDEFEPQLGSLNSRLNADPRVITFQRDWSGCMTAVGFNYTNENAMVDDIYARLLEIDLLETGGVTQVESSASVDDLIDYERQVAVAGFDCRQGFVGDLEQLRHDYEREFLDDNRFRIADLQLQDRPNG